MEKSHKYAAFISYAHADERVAKKLHERLETYPLPKGMDKAERSKLFPVFRDVTELTAHHSLSEKIRDAVKTSRFLIVLCSPASKKSHWVNEEIKLFRKLHGEGSILAVIVEGVPDTAFPPALTADGREPLAANMATNEGFRFGVTQLAASMLGVGLDRLVQRDQRRRRIRTQLVTGVTTALAIIMGGLAWTAIDARDEAEEALGKAEVSRNEAEKMVEFLIGDLKDDLTPIQKLDLFDGIGKRVSDYYDAIPIEDMDDDRMMRRARSMHILGDVEIRRGNYKNAENILRQAYLTSEDVYIRNPENTAVIYVHAQSEYWVGWNLYKREKFASAAQNFQRYFNFGQELFKTNPDNFNWVMENAWGHGNQGLVNLRLGNHLVSEDYYNKAISLFEQALEMSNNSSFVRSELANVLDGAAQNSLKVKKPNIAEKQYLRSSSEFSSVLQKDPSNNHLKFRYLQTTFRHLSIRFEDQCKSTSFMPLFDGIRKLALEDKSNTEWQLEYFSQWYRILDKCSAIKTDIQNFVRQSKPYSSDVKIQELRKKVTLLPEF